MSRSWPDMNPSLVLAVLEQGGLWHSTHPHVFEDTTQFWSLEAVMWKILPHVGCDHVRACFCLTFFVVCAFFSFTFSLCWTCVISRQMCYECLSVFSTCVFLSHTSPAMTSIYVAYFLCKARGSSTVKETGLQFESCLLWSWARHSNSGPQDPHLRRWE